MKPRLTRRETLVALAAALPRLGAHAHTMPLASALDDLRSQFDLPSLAAAAFSKESILAEGIAGVRHRHDTTAATLDDRYHIGSITKSMTAVLAGHLVEHKQLTWDATLGSVLGQFPLHDQIKPVTLWQLLRHRSGIERDIPDDLYDRLKLSRRAPMAQRTELGRVMLARPPRHPPDSVYEYSNAGYTFAGLMLERVGGKPWESLVKEHLFQPLGLKSAGFGAPAKDPKRLDQPWGHHENGSPVTPGPKADNVPAIGPAGTVHLSVREFVRYARWHLDETGPLKPAIVSPPNLQRLHGTGQPDAYYGGWNRVTRSWAHGQAITHAGSNTMFYSVVWLVPERDRGFIALCNQGGKAAESACDSAIAALIPQFCPVA
jgi:CubicO group peptidase (beta-lactamase class C family)